MNNLVDREMLVYQTSKLCKGFIFGDNTCREHIKTIQYSFSLVQMLIMSKVCNLIDILSMQGFLFGWLVFVFLHWRGLTNTNSINFLDYDVSEYEPDYIIHYGSCKLECTLHEQYDNLKQYIPSSSFIIRSI